MHIMEMTEASLMSMLYQFADSQQSKDIQIWSYIHHVSL